SGNDVLTFTALSEKGIAVWGSKLIDLSSEEIIAYVKGNLTIGKVNGVVADITLPTEGDYETEISWESSQPDVVSDEGVVNRPDSDRNVSVSLTATINKDDITDTKKFTVTVLPLEEDGIVSKDEIIPEDELESAEKKVSTISIVLWIYLGILMLGSVIFFVVKRRKS